MSQNSTSSTISTVSNNFFNNDFLSFNQRHIDLGELLRDLIGQKDRVTGEVFCPGEKIHLCTSCQLGYHSDSWEFLNRTCEQCKSGSKVTTYVLPSISVSNPTNNFSSSPTVGIKPRNTNEDYISALDLDTIRRNVGRSVSIKGIARVVREDGNGNIYFEFTENQYRGFYAYVTASSSHEFPNFTSYSGRNVVICGMVSINKKNRPRMALNDSSQLRIA